MKFWKIETAAGLYRGVSLLQLPQTFAILEFADVMNSFILTTKQLTLYWDC